ncbi:hypothetical protein C8J57DRAFT_1230162 [Mycena rebaudengoi]|nr:hypothetical protein C8J57DRAFT_1230162 [Mycena rebaudengoi]
MRERGRDVGGQGVEPAHHASDVRSGLLLRQKAGWECQRAERAEGAQWEAEKEQWEAGRAEMRSEMTMGEAERRAQHADASVTAAVEVADQEDSATVVHRGACCARSRTSSGGSVEGARASGVAEYEDKESPETLFGISCGFFMRHDTISSIGIRECLLMARMPIASFECLSQALNAYLIS